MRKKLKEQAQELMSWLENYDRKDAQQIMEIVGRMLASVPGGDDWEDAGFEPYQNVGWKEYEMVTDLLQSVDSKSDVQDLADYFLGDEAEDDEEDDDE